MEKFVCNPLDLEYRYQYRTSLMGGHSLSREAADPTMLLFHGTYYLFASMSGGFWYSDDLAQWDFKETPELPIYDYALHLLRQCRPAARGFSAPVRALRFLGPGPL